MPEGAVEPLQAKMCRQTPSQWDFVAYTHGRDLQAIRRDVSL
jgi:hypothetical protein